MSLYRIALLSLFYFSLSTIAFTQRVSVDYIMGEKETVVERYDLSRLDFFHERVPFSFAGDSVSAPAIRKVGEGTVYQVDMVFSDFKSASTFSQDSLNRRRLKSLQEAIPGLFNQTHIRWNLVRQSAANTRQEAMQLFHGFVFHLRTPMFVEKATDKAYYIDGKAEIDLLHSILGDTLPKDYSTELPLPITSLRDTLIRKWTDSTATIARTGRWVPVLKRKRDKGVLFKRKFIWKRPPEEIFSREYASGIDTIILADGILIVCTLSYYPFRMDSLTHFNIYTDSVVQKTFSEHPEWKNLLVVEDVTGSMYPYLGQTVAWRRLTKGLDRLQHWGFFNDGDSHPDGPVGRSDGVHFLKSNKYQKIEDKAWDAMKAGNGGAGPENDIEAMQKSLDRSKFSPEAILLIADNNSQVRDLSLFSRLRSKSIPIYVIVCGALWGNINVEYLEIARRTGGKVFTMEGELEGLLKLREGDTVKAGRQKFKVQDGKLMLIR